MPSILIIDDDKPSLLAMEAVCSRGIAGATVATALSAKSALQLISAEDFDLIVSDIRMPGMDGLALLGEIRKLRPNAPVILTTSYDEPQYAIKALRLGANDLLRKPLVVDHFIASALRCVNTRLEQKRLEAEHKKIEARTLALEQEIERRIAESEARNRFLLNLAGATQALTVPADVMAVTAKLLAEHLDVERCAYAEIEDEKIFVITGDHTRGVPSIVGRWPVAAFGTACVELMRANQPYVVDNVDTDLRIEAADLPAYRATNIQSVICVPLHKAGKFSAAMAVHQTRPRKWTLQEVDLVHTVVRQCWETLERTRVARTLQQSEERLRMAQRAARAAAWEWNCRTNEVFWSEGIWSHLEMEPNSFKPDLNRWLEFIHPDDRQPSFVAAQRAFETGEDYNFEFRLVLNSGKVVWLDSFGRVVNGADGKPERMLGINIDITSRKAAAENLLQHERLLRIVTEHTHVGLVIVSPEHRYLYANQAYARVLGLSSHEIVGTRIADVLPNVYETQIRPRLEKAFQGERVQYELLVPGSGDRGSIERYVIVAYEPQREDGAVSNVVVAVSDITGHRQTQNALRESEKRLSTLVSVVTDVPWTVDAVGAFLEPQPAWELFTGHKFEDYKNFGWSKAMHPDDRERVQGDWQRAVDARQTYTSHYRLWHHSQGWRHVVARAKPLINDEGAVYGWVGSCTDIDVQKRYEEELKENDRRKDEFIAMLAHELRNPLAPIRNGAQILRQIAPDDERIEKIRGIIDRQAAHMSRIVDDLLDVSRITQGKILLKKEVVDLAMIVRETCADYEQEAAKSSVGIDLRISGDRTHVLGDKTRLSQCIGNLLHNAIKFSSRGSQITVELVAGGSTAVVTISDTGIGIDPEILPILFEPFVQARQTLDRSRGGLGLGLALVKGLLRLHDGTISATSEGAGRGAQFKIELPIVASAGSQAADTSVSGPGQRILIIEDSEDAAETMRMLLELEQNEVQTASSGEAALRLVDAWRPDIVLCDIGLPKMDGYEVCRQLRRRPDLKSASIFALTGYGQEEDVRRATAAGFDRHLTKPVDPVKLMEAIRDAASKPAR